MSLKIGIPAGIVALLAAVWAITSWERPPIATAQTGFRGTGMAQVENPRVVRANLPLHAVPPAPEPASAEGDRARDIYENVPVLGHLSVEQFGRIMQAMTEWIYPGEGPNLGCNGCHVEGNFAAENVYQKIVSRRMIQMVQHINANFASHVGQTGVTCYTCHRGNAVPANVWSQAPAPLEARGMATTDTGQNRAAPASGLASLPFDPFTPFLLNNQPIRMTSAGSLSPGSGRSIQSTEWTYGLMIHMSEGLGVNCTYCHNTRNFAEWSLSSPQRTVAWYGLAMVRSINGEYIEPLRPNFPPHRLGPLGDTLKTNCTTCHQGVARPLLGAPMLADYPELLLPQPARTN